MAFVIGGVGHGEIHVKIPCRRPSADDITALVAAAAKMKSINENSVFVRDGFLQARCHVGVSDASIKRAHKVLTDRVNKVFGFIPEMEAVASE